METKNEQLSIAAKSTHPGEMLHDWLDDVGIKQKDFARAIGIQASRLNELIKGRRPMTADLAMRIADELGGVDATFWMRAQAEYEYNEKMLALRNESLRKADSQEDGLRGLFNLRELYGRLKISDVSSIRRIRELFSILGATYEEMTNRTAIVGCFKHSDTLRVDERNLRTWVLLAQYIAEHKKVDGNYSVENAKTAAIEIAHKANAGSLTNADIDNILSQHGIAYAVVKKMPQCPVDAYSVMLKENPAIIVTHRHNNMQKLIFDVLHEIGHITKHMTGEYSDFLNMEYSQHNPMESEANAFARDMLIPPAVWNKIMQMTTKSLKQKTVFKDIGERAKTLGIDPRIAVARYKHDSQQYAGYEYAPTKII